MKKIILASNNTKKIKELKQILNELNCDVYSLKDMNIDIDVEEDGKTFEENAQKKAYEIYKHLKCNGINDFIVLSDDSGLEVDYLNGEPGIYSARYSGEHGNDYKNNMKLLDKMKDAKGKDREARFVCVIAVVFDNGRVETVRGEVEGIIKEQLEIEGGFGYDPLFYYKDFNKTFAEATPEEKNSISHRGKALGKLKSLLNKI